MREVGIEWDCDAFYNKRKYVKLKERKTKLKVYEMKV